MSTAEHQLQGNHRHGGATATAAVEDHACGLLWPSTPRRSRRFEKALTFVEVAADYIAILLVVAFACKMAFGPSSGFAAVVAYAWYIAVLVALVIVLMLDREGAYRPCNSLLRVKETERILRVATELLVVATAAAVILRPGISLAMLIGSAGGVAIALVAEKQLIYSSVRALHVKGIGVRRGVIYGAGYTGRRVFSSLARSPKLGLNPVLMVDDDASLCGTEIFERSYKRSRSVPVVQGPVSPQMLQDVGASLVIVAVPSLSKEKFGAAVNAATEAGAEIAFVPGNFLPSDLWLEHVDIDGLLLASIEVPIEPAVYKWLKRALDLFLGTAILVCTAPLIALLVALIRLDSHGPAMFVQRRVGKDGKEFDLYKFRTMHADAPVYHYSPTDRHDTRITRFGRFLRTTSLDELPQLLNVLHGTMTLVGPRQEMPFIVEKYLPIHRQRLRVKPGLTGLWQISADRSFLIHENIEYDLYYIKNRNFFMDLAILLHTV